MYRLIERLAQDERGATAIEYGLIISLIVIALIASMGNVANSTTNMWNNVSTEVQEAHKQ